MILRSTCLKWSFSAAFVLLVTLTFSIRPLMGNVSVRTKAENLLEEKAREWETLTTRFRGVQAKLQSEYFEGYQKRWQAFVETQEKKLQASPPRTPAEHAKALSSYRGELRKFLEAECKEVLKLQQASREAVKEYYKQLGDASLGFRTWVRKNYGAEDRSARIEARKQDNAQRESFHRDWMTGMRSAMISNAPRPNENVFDFSLRTGVSQNAFLAKINERSLTLISSTMLSGLQSVVQNDQAARAVVQTALDRNFGILQQMRARDIEILRQIVASNDGTIQAIHNLNASRIQYVQNLQLFYLRQAGWYGDLLFR